MGDHIGGVLISAPVPKLYLLGPCIQNGIGISRPQQGSPKFQIATNHPSSTDLISNWDSHDGINILVKSVDVIINAAGAISICIGIRHGLRRNIFVLVILIARYIKVSKVRVILLIIRRHRGYQLVYDGLVILKAQLRLVRRGQLIGGQGSHIWRVGDLAIGLQDCLIHRGSNVDLRSDVAPKLHFGVGKFDGCVTILHPCVPRILCHSRDISMISKDVCL
jgi:hypothetical protein